MFRASTCSSASELQVGNQSRGMVICLYVKASGTSIVRLGHVKARTRSFGQDRSSIYEYERLRQSAIPVCLSIKYLTHSAPPATLNFAHMSPSPPPSSKSSSKPHGGHRPPLPSTQKARITTLLASGLTARAIASIEDISPATVRKIHRNLRLWGDHTTPRVYPAGRKKRLTGERIESLRAYKRENPAKELVELQGWVFEKWGVWVNTSTIWRYSRPDEEEEKYEGVIMR